MVVVGDQLHNDQGEVIGTHGFYVDVSPLPDREREDLVTAQLAEIAEQHAGIEQAKGMLMLVYGIGDDAAFDLLKWLSQEANIKLRLLAEQILGPRPSSQSDYDHLLMTAHERVDPTIRSRS